MSAAPVTAQPVGPDLQRRASAEALAADPEALAALACRLRRSTSFPGGVVDAAGSFRADVASAAEVLAVLAGASMPDPC